MKYFQLLAFNRNRIANNTFVYYKTCIPKESCHHLLIAINEYWQTFFFSHFRRMFPPIKVDLNGLKPSASYILLMDLVPVDKYRYKYQNSSWVKCFEESCSPTRLYVHPESPAPGSYWMDHVISFYKLKLTNNQLDKQGHVCLTL